MYLLEILLYAIDCFLFSFFVFGFKFYFLQFLFVKILFLLFTYLLIVLHKASVILMLGTNKRKMISQKKPSGGPCLKLRTDMTIDRAGPKRKNISRG